MMVFEADVPSQNGAARGHTTADNSVDNYEA